MEKLRLQNLHTYGCSRKNKQNKSKLEFSMYLIKKQKKTKTKF